MVQVNEGGSSGSGSGSGGGPPTTAAGSRQSRSRLLGQFYTSPDSLPPLRSRFYIHSPGSKASSVKNVSPSKVTRPLNQKKSVHISLSPSESSSQSSSVGSPTSRYRPRDSRSPSFLSIDPLIQTFVRLLEQDFVPPKKEISKKTPPSCPRISSKTWASIKSVMSSR